MSHISRCRSMFFAIVAWCALGTALAQEGAGCKDKEEGDACWTMPFKMDYDFLFSYTHEQQLEKSLKYMLPKYGIAVKDSEDEYSKDMMKLIRIVNSKGKEMDLNFLHLPDIFDGAVTPNDFPVKVYLNEVWKGTCSGWGKTKGTCVGVRAPLVDACEGKSINEECSYDSLKLIGKRGKALPSFVGKCVSNGDDSVKWCKFMTSKEHQIEACQGKLAGKKCEWSRNGKGYEDLQKGVCMGAYDGIVLSCQSAKAPLIDACDGKVFGDKCGTSVTGQALKCGYSQATLLCMDMAAKPKPIEDEPKPIDGGKPKPAPAPSDGGSCSSLEKDVKYTRWMLDKVGAKLGVETAKPTPAPAPAKPSRRRGSRRRRRKQASM